MSFGRNDFSIWPITRLWANLQLTCDKLVLGFFLAHNTPSHNTPITPPTAPAPQHPPSHNTHPLPPPTREYGQCAAVRFLRECILLHGGFWYEAGHHLSVNSGNYWNPFGEEDSQIFRILVISLKIIFVFYLFSESMIMVFSLPIYLLHEASLPYM